MHSFESYPERSKCYKAFFNCGTENDLLNITNFNVEPFPIEAGKNVTVQIVGKLSDTLSNSTKVTLQGSIGPFKFLDTTKKLCTLVNQYNLTSCPIKPGSFNYTMTQIAPEDIPATEIEFLLKSETGEGEQVACVNGRVSIVREKEDD